MKKPVVAVISFPGNNCEVESLRAIKESGMDAMFFRWNDSREKLKDVDGYFLPGGFSYEDRGRSGMVAGRDPILQFLHEESEMGKVIIGNCNGAQILVESGLIPLDRGLRMSLARNAIEQNGSWQSVGFLNEWVWITRSCAPDRCATSNWEGTMHLPIAHGEGRFTTRDKDVIAEIRKNNQIAFSYCTEHGKMSEDPYVTPNGSMFAIAGLCNPAGNVVALMPHPERTPNGKPYFDALRYWILNAKVKPSEKKSAPAASWKIQKRASKGTEVFIDTLITNNEERTVEQAAKHIVTTVRLKQWKYYSLPEGKLEVLLSDIAVFNANKERAIIRDASGFRRWNHEKKRAEPMDSDTFAGISLVKRDIPDTGAGSFGEGSETGICYTLKGVEEKDLQKSDLLEIFANPHASTLERLL